MYIEHGLRTEATIPYLISDTPQFHINNEEMVRVSCLSLECDPKLFPDNT